MHDQVSYVVLRICVHYLLLTIQLVNLCWHSRTHTLGDDYNTQLIESETNVYG